MKAFFGGLRTLKIYKMTGLLKGYTREGVYEIIQWVICDRGGFIQRMTV